MQLWTMQPVEVYEILMQDGVFRTDPQKVDMPEFLTAYDWLNQYLERKTEKPATVSYPVWAWYRFNGKEKKPDLRHSCYGRRGEKMVCLELEVPDNEVLLSDFDLWHFPLNNWWLDIDVFQDDYTEEQYDESHRWFDSLSKENQQKEKDKSWQKIFDIEPYENDWIAKGKYVQAVFWELKLEYVKKVQFFTAR